MAKIMSFTEAHNIIDNMLHTAVNDTIALKERIDDLKREYAADPYWDTEAQIKRLQARLDKRTEEAKALAIAATRF